MMRLRMNSQESAVGVLERHYIATCRVCGEPLSKNRRIFCSMKCCKKSTNKNYKFRLRHPRVEPKKCIVCGKTITNHRTKYCSSKCRRRRNTDEQWNKREMNRDMKSKPLKTRNCVICGNPFLVTSVTRLTCSPECARKAMYKKQAEYKAKTRDNFVKYGDHAEVNTKIRKCLKCDEPFPSTGNYICPRCTTENDYICKGTDIGFYNRLGATI